MKRERERVSQSSIGEGKRRPHQDSLINFAYERIQISFGAKRQRTQGQKSAKVNEFSLRVRERRRPGSLDLEGICSRLSHSADIQ
jgi:hypothetical protein